MTDERAYYLSSHSSVIEAWEDTQQRWREVHDAIGALEKRYDRKALVQSGNNSYRIACLSGDKPEGPWRQTDHGWVPDRRSKAGKELAAELAAMAVKRLGEFPGMPDMVIDTRTSVWYHPGAQLINGVIWVAWGCPAELVESGAWGRFDPDVWTRAKASAYHLAIESVQADQPQAVPA